MTKVNSVSHTYDCKLFLKEMLSLLCTALPLLVDDLYLSISRQISFFVKHKSRICMKSEFLCQRPYKILSLSRKDEMTNIGLTFKGQHQE